MFEYKTLQNTTLEILHETFLSAFSDYQVKIDLPFSKFEQMMKRRGYIPEMSIGAFKNEALVGFVLNGFRNWNGNQVAYDTGTGVIPQYRKQGITNTMILNVKKLFEEKEVEQYLLEVIQENTAAVQLYKKQGFEIVRELECFQLDKNKYKSITNFKVEHIDKIDSENWEKIKTFWEYIPSWQNSIDSINAVPDTFVYSVVRIDSAIVGYGIIGKKTGDIPQFAVDKKYRGRGIGRSIFTSLLENTESDNIGVLNVEGQSKATKDFLLKLGFEFHVAQYEMILKL